MSIVTAVLIALCLTVWLNLWARSNADAAADHRGWVFRAASAAFGIIRDVLERPYRWVERKATR